MLLSGLLSDTLAFKSSTTTPRDRGSAMWLAWHAFGVDDAEQRVTEYGDALLRSGADISGRSADDMIKTDFKEFSSGPVKFGVSQVEVTNFVPIMARMDEIQPALRTMQEQRGLNSAALMITDIVENQAAGLCGDLGFSSACHSRAKPMA